MKTARVFASYAHIDDTATHGRVKYVVEDVGNSYESLTGSRVSTFMDVTSLRPGDIWRTTIDSNLESASILLAFVSPAALRSKEWRREVRRFLDAPEMRLVIPLVFGDRVRIREEFGRDPDVSEIYDHVMRIMQETLDALAAERRLPLIG